MAKMLATALSNSTPSNDSKTKSASSSGVVEQLRAEHGRLSEENQRLARELGARAKLVEPSGVARAPALRDERDLIRARVTDMLEQLEALNL